MSQVTDTDLHAIDMTRPPVWLVAYFNKPEIFGKKQLVWDHLSIIFVKFE